MYFYEKLNKLKKNKLSFLNDYNFRANIILIMYFIIHE